MTAQELTAARTARGLSKYALAKRMGIGRSRINDLETGRLRITDKMAARIQVALAQETPA